MYQSFLPSHNYCIGFCVQTCYLYSRLGSSLIALRLVRAEAPLAAEKVLELGHHILKAHIYKGVNAQGVEPVHLQSYWTCLSTNNLSSALVTPRNIFSPNVKVSFIGKVISDA